jgi:hypothetical protein
MLQVNSRFRAKDEIEDEPEEEAFTGGTFVYLSPGVRVRVRDTSLYALVQLPVYQDVNGLQITSRMNFVGGVQIAF